MSAPFLALALAGIAVLIVSSVAVTAYVSKRGVKINYFLWRIMIFRYFNDYCRLTTQETGRIGVWYYTFLAAMILTSVFVVIGIIIR